jgi:hypothetical protein
VPAPDLLELFVAPLNKADFTYMATGAVAAIVYGEPRLTRDIDLIVTIRRAQVAELEKMFPSPAFYFPPEDVVVAEIEKPRGGHFNVIHTDSSLKADIYPAGEDELNRWGLEHRRRVQAGDQPLWVAPPEYVIIRKLEYWRDGGSEKQLRDIRVMLRTLGDDVDTGRIASEVHGRGLTAQWTSALERE